MLAHLGVEVVPCRGLHRPGGGIEQLRVAAVAGDTPGQLEQCAGVERRSLGIAAVRRDDELVPQELDDFLRGVGPELQAHSGELAALFQQLTHNVAEVNIVVHHTFVDRDIGIAGHAEKALLGHGAGAENRGGVVGDELFHKGEAGRLAVLYEEYALKLAADRHDAVADALVFRVQLSNVVDILVVQKREWMAGVDNLGAEQREQFALEVGFPEMFLRLGQLGEIDFLVAFGGQCRDKVLEIFIALGLQFRHAGRDGGNLLGGGHVGDVVGLVVFQERLVVERTDAHHKELVHVAAKDGGKLDALAQRHGLFLCQGQYAAVKVEPAEFTVDEDAFRLFFQVDLLHLLYGGKARPAFCHAQGYPLDVGRVSQRRKCAVSGAVCDKGGGLLGAKARQGGQFLGSSGVDVDDCRGGGRRRRGHSRRDIHSGGALRLPHRRDEEQRPQDNQRRCGSRQRCEFPGCLHGRVPHFLLNFNYSTLL